MKRKNWSIFFIGMLAMCTIAGCIIRKTKRFAFLERTA